MVKEEHFIVNTSIPNYLYRVIKGRANKSQYLRNAVRKNITKIEKMLQNNSIKDVAFSLPYSQILEIRELAKKYNTTEGRILMMALQIEYFKEILNGDNAKEEGK